MSAKSLSLSNITLVAATISRKNSRVTLGLESPPPRTCRWSPLNTASPRSQDRVKHYSAHVILCLFAVAGWTPNAFSHAPPANVYAAVSMDPVVVPLGTLYFGGRYLAPPYKLSHFGSALVVNGFRLGKRRGPEKRPVTASDFAKLEHQLSLEAGGVISNARVEGLSDDAIYERLARFYRASDLVLSARYDRKSLSVTYRSNPTQPVYIGLPRPSTPFSKAEREQSRLRENRAEIHEVKRMLEGGGILLITPAGRLYISRSRAIEAAEAIRRFQETGSSTGLSSHVPPDLWTYLREPALEAVP